MILAELSDDVLHEAELFGCGAEWVGEFLAALGAVVEDVTVVGQAFF